MELLTIISQFPEPTRILFGSLFGAVCGIGLVYVLHFGSTRGSTPTNNGRDLRGPGPPLKAADHINDGKHHLLLAATGSVATIKIPNIVQALSKHKNLSIRILLSESASEFLQAQSEEQPSLKQIASLPNVDGVYLDHDEWRKPWVRGDNILHIELRRWADLMLIAPLSANSLAKIAQGLSDNLITSVVRAWDATGILDPARPGVPLPFSGTAGARGDKKGIIVAPAMNTAMWHHPLTAEHLRRLEVDWAVSNGGWFEVLRPVEKVLACGDTGSGAMHKWEQIVKVVQETLLHENEKVS
ncbi:Protein SIS2 [Teratosphaeria destructans]|uniref:Protein SIS2 n=1 Tax=Teratosphaeria destructans TaxID=418781 RepID=A0A9W7SIA4_9PEZI|nr:Protein SIS2 [Teratosphaeria destructans]